MHLVTIDWARGRWSGTRGKYSREHQWHFAGRLSLKVSDALSPAAYRDTARLDPLKSYVATIASAHMWPGCMLPSATRWKSRSTWTQPKAW